jgi:nucleoside triphosphate pyrophosphatase
MSELFFAADRPSVYLASRSPRRQALLRQLGVDFQELSLREAPGRRRDIVEVPRRDESAMDYVRRVAATKAGVGWQRMLRRELTPRPVLAADTEVVLDDRPFGKPDDAADAFAMLMRLSGKTHQVITAVALRWRAQAFLEVSASRVSFRALTEGEVERYVASGEPLDKAGAYAIQGRAGAFISRLEGSYSGVMGLPLCETSEILTRIGLHVL